MHVDHFIQLVLLVSEKKEYFKRFFLVGAHLGSEVVEITIACHVKTRSSTTSKNWGRRLECSSISEGRNGHSGDHCGCVGSHCSEICTSRWIVAMPFHYFSERCCASRLVERLVASLLTYTCENFCPPNKTDPSFIHAVDKQYLGTVSCPYPR